MSFNGHAFIQHVAQRLVQEFEFAAGAGTPGLVGSAKEHPARVQLERLMPHGISVGSGIAVDSYGGVSNQQDIVIYEKLCPLFTHNGAAEASYFPVEGVVAAGEVKSTLNKRELEDAFAKSQSVKALRRHAVMKDEGLGPPTVAFRGYGNPMSLIGTKEEEFNQDAKSLHQVYTFVLCQQFGASPVTMIENALELYRSVGRPFGPNLIVSLKEGFIVPCNTNTNSITRAAMDADGLLFCDQASEAFGQLLWFLRLYARSGKTVDVEHYDRYFRPIGEEQRLHHVVARGTF